MENSVNAVDNYYLLKLTNLQTRVSEAKVVTKGSVTDRSVELTFNVNTGAEPKFTMQEVSFFKYDVYEQTSPTNTSITDASVLGLRETGKAWVGGTSEVTYIKQEEADKTNDVYLKV
tara:strand:- start:5 stop:355 length:351 start_codon:yes stop_codon:yes gene_type:complete